MFGLFIIEAGQEPRAVLNIDNKPLVFEDGATAARYAGAAAAGNLYTSEGYKVLKCQPRRLANDAWKTREAGRFADGTYIPLPWADLPALSLTAEHFAHVSTEDGAKIAYTADASKGAGDIQTRVKPGKYLQQFYGAFFDAPTIARMAAQFSLQYGESLVLQFASTADDIERVYENGPHSCMAHEASHFDSSVHPCSIYAAGDLAVAYLERGGAITARVLCWPDKKLYGRMYGDEVRLEDLLTEAGYACGDLDGARMLRIKEGHGFVCPYIDGTQSAGDDGRFLILGGKGLNGSNQNGLSGNMLCCEACGDGVDEEDCQSDDAGNSYCNHCFNEVFGYCEYTEETCLREGMGEVIVRYLNGRAIVQSWSESAINDDAFECEGDGKLYHNDLCVELSDGTQWSQEYFEDHGSVCEGNSECYASDDCVQLEDGTLWSKDYFADNGVEVDGKLYAKGDEPEQDADDCPELAAVIIKHYRASPYVKTDAQLEMPLAVAGTITVGSWVECTSTIAGQFTAGRLYQVSRVDSDPDRLSVVFDDAGDANGWLAKYFKLASALVSA